MKKAMLLLIPLIFASCGEIDKAELNDKLTSLQEKSLENEEQLENVKIELQKQTEKIEEQSAKIDTLIKLDKEIIVIIKRNHTEEKGILSNILETIKDIFE